MSGAARYQWAHGIRPAVMTDRCVPLSAPSLCHGLTRLRARVCSGTVVRWYGTRERKVAILQERFSLVLSYGSPAFALVGERRAFARVPCAPFLAQR
jgi:hypothetical protein